MSPILVPLYSLCVDAEDYASVIQIVQEWPSEYRLRSLSLYHLDVSSTGLVAAGSLFVYACAVFENLESVTVYQDGLSRGES